MTDNGTERILSRRERRLLETQEQSTHEAIQSSPESPEPPEVVVDETPTEADEIAIDLYDEHGNLRSRREIRELRAQALAELSTKSEPEPEPESEAIPEADVAEAVADAAEAPEASDEEEAAEALHDGADVPTEALSIEELREIAESQVDGQEPQAVEPEGESESSDDGSEEEPAGVADAADDFVGADANIDTDVEADEASDAAVTDPTHEPVDEETIREPEVPKAAPETYSFPDIRPIEEERPVFDDLASRTVGGSADDDVVDDATEDSGTKEPNEGNDWGPITETTASAFDDVIERAVADESASVHHSSSSLILPAIPEGERLSGPMGATGELFITGSIDLPKTLGETGGHAGIQDSISAKDADDDPVEMLELSSLYESSDFDSAPVSAKQAVSSRSSERTGAVTPEVQRDNKKSVALALTGGGLLLVLVAGGVWLFTSGFFG